MSQNNFPKELSDLIGRIESLNFVTDKEVASVTPKCNGNFNNTLNFNNKSRVYFANVNLGVNHYKLYIWVKGNRPNPKYEKQIKKLF